MTASSPTPGTAQRPLVTPLKTALADVYKGFLDVSHNGMALLGTAIVVAVITLIARADLRADAEQQLLGWLLQRQETTVVAQTATEDPLTKAEMEAIKAIDKNCRLVKGQVFTWKGATWEDLWKD